MRRASALASTRAPADGRRRLLRGTTPVGHLLHRRNFSNLIALSTRTTGNPLRACALAPVARHPLQGFNSHVRKVTTTSSSSSSSSSDAAKTPAAGSPQEEAPSCKGPFTVREELLPRQAQSALLVDEDESLSIDPQTYAFDEESADEKWERIVGIGTSSPSYVGRLGTSLGRAEERLAKKFSIDLNYDYDDDGGEEGDEEADDDDDEDDVPSGFLSTGGRRAPSISEKDQDEEETQQQEYLTPHERRRRAREQERDAKWDQIISPLRTYGDVDKQIISGKHIPFWYPHVDEYDGDGYDDYARTLQTTEEDSPYHRDYEYNEREFKHHFSYLDGQNSHIINVGRHTKTTKGGRVFSFSATVINGNGEGRAGWGYGKGPTLSDAVLAAQKDCEKNSFFIDRYKGQCVTESIRFSYKKCTVELFALPEGRIYPLSSQVMQLVFNAFGLKYIAGKWRGSTNKTKRIKTLFMALQQIEHPDYLSEKLGMKLFKPRKIPRKHGRIWTYD